MSVKSFALCILLAVLEFDGTYGVLSAKDTASGTGLYERGGLTIIGEVITVAGGVNAGQDTALGVDTGPLLPTPLNETEPLGFDSLRICSKYSTSPGLNPPPFRATISPSTPSTTGGVLGLYSTATLFSGSQIFFRTDNK